MPPDRRRKLAAPSAAGWHRRPSVSMPAAAGTCNLLVVGSRDAPELEVLGRLPQGVHVVGIGRALEDFKQLSDADWASVDVLLNCGVGKNAAKRDDIQVR